MHISHEDDGEQLEFWVESLDDPKVHIALHDHDLPRLPTFQSGWRRIFGVALLSASLLAAYLPQVLPRPTNQIPTRHPTTLSFTPTNHMVETTAAAMLSAHQQQALDNAWQLSGFGDWAVLERTMRPSPTEAWQCIVSFDTPGVEPDPDHVRLIELIAYNTNQNGTYTDPRYEVHIERQPGGWNVQATLQVKNGVAYHSGFAQGIVGPVERSPMPYDLDDASVQEVFQIIDQTLQDAGVSRSADTFPTE